MMGEEGFVELGDASDQHRAKKGRPTIERRRGGLPSGEEKAAYHRARKGRPTEYTENTELPETEIDAVGIKMQRKYRKTPIGS